MASSFLVKWGYAHFLPQTKVVSLHKRFGPLRVQQPDQKNTAGLSHGDEEGSFLELAQEAGPHWVWL